MEDTKNPDFQDVIDAASSIPETPAVWLVTVESDGGTWKVPVKPGESEFVALQRTQREYVNRKMESGPALAPDGSGAEKEPPANIIASRDPKTPPHTAVTVGGHGKFVLPPEDQQLSGWYEPFASLIISTFPQYKVPEPKG